MSEATQTEIKDPHFLNQHAAFNQVWTQFT